MCRKMDTFIVSVFVHTFVKCIIKMLAVELKHVVD